MLPAEFRAIKAAERPTSSSLTGRVQSASRVRPPGWLLGRVVPNVGGAITRQKFSDSALYDSPFNVSMTWVDNGGPDSLLDLSTNTLPTVVESGVYSVGLTFTASLDATDPGTSLLISLDVDSGGEDANAAMQVATYGGVMTLDVSRTWYCVAGAQLLARFFQYGQVGGTSYSYGWFMYVQRLS